MKTNRIFSYLSTRLYVTVFVTVLMVTIARQLWWQYVVSWRPPLGLFGILVIAMPFVCLMAIAVVLVMAIGIWTVRRAGSVVPAALLTVGVVLAFHVPLPSRPDTPEKLHFLAHRGDYEATVNQIILDELSPCATNGSRFQRLNPKPELNHVSARACIDIIRSNVSGLVVWFHPLTPYYHSIVYTESGDIEPICDTDPYVEQQIDQHWYVCTFEWN